MRVHYLKTSWHSPDCASCMMIETGEKTSQVSIDGEHSFNVTIFLSILAWSEM